MECRTASPPVGLSGRRPPGGGCCFIRSSTLRIRGSVAPAYRAEIGLDRVGLEVEAIVRIKASGQGLDKATRTLCAFPEVLECHRATGGDCFVLRVAVSDIKELQRLLDRIAPFGDLTTSVILSTPLRQKTIRN